VFFTSTAVVEQTAEIGGSPLNSSAELGGGMFAIDALTPLAQAKAVNSTP